jgi:predicted phage terminase large subunit-like protein
MTASEIAEIIEAGYAGEKELASRHLIDFAQRLVSGFHAAAHLRYLAELLESVERRERSRLLVTLFPGSGKSTLLQAFVSWHLGRRPGAQILAASNSELLAERNSRFARDLFANPRWPFPDVSLNKDTTAVHRWSTTSGGSFTAFGAGSIITGWRADLLLLDDVQKDALSISERDSLWEWYSGVLLDRLNPGGAIVLINQRWNSDDIVARILDAPDGHEWEVVRLPAIAEANDPLGREPGESLWPEKWPKEELERRRASRPRKFECQYQGNPVPLEGDFFDTEWFKQRYDAAPTDFTKVVCFVDSAAKTGERNDYSVILKLGVTKNEYFVLDVWRAKVEFPALLRRVDALAAEDPAPSTVYAEDTSNATALIQAMQSETRAPIVAVKVKGSKEARAESVTGICEAKKVFLPKDAPWLLDFERELFSFPGGKHDDQVDAFVGALSQVAMRKASSYFAEVGYGEPESRQPPCLSCDACKQSRYAECPQWRI